jgi:hypothetical protein
MSKPWNEFTAADVRALVDQRFWYDHDRGCWAHRAGLCGTRFVTEVIECLGGNRHDRRTREAVEQILRAIEREPAEAAA